MGSMKSSNIRFATESDLDIIIKYIKELADYEKMTDRCSSSAGACEATPIFRKAICGSNYCGA